MCIIQGENVHVSNTCLLISPTTNGQQLTVYANTVKLDNSRVQGAMILPYPSGQLATFINLQGCENLFTELATVFTPLSRSVNFFTNQCDSLLEVENVGSYNVSNVPSLDDFPRLNREIFTIDPRVFNCLQEYYREGFSFVVCQLQADAEYHPFAYIHNRQPNGQLFIPTRHFHLGEDGQNHTDWDHQIYTWNCSLNGNFIKKYPQRNRFESNIHSMINLCRLEQPRTLFQYKITDFHENLDLSAVVSV